eukprot:9488226-Pyramimonas_sp.AAC.1
MGLQVESPSGPRRAWGAEIAGGPGHHRWGHRCEGVNAWRGGLGGRGNTEMPTSECVSSMGGCYYAVGAHEGLTAP